MTNETFLKLIHLLGMTQKECATAAGYSFNTINAISANKLKVSIKLQEFIISKLKEHESDEAIQIILKECSHE